MLTLIAIVLLAIVALVTNVFSRKLGKIEGLKLGEKIGKWTGEGENICKVGWFSDLFRALNANSLKFTVENILPLSNFEGRQYSIVVIILDKLVMWDGEKKFFPHPADSRRDTRYVMISMDLKIGQTYSITQTNRSIFDETLITEEYN